MSLSGNLEALSLPELLQIVALSRKTGALEICSDHGVAWLGLQDGGIVRVARDNDIADRETVLKNAGIGPQSDTEQVESALWNAAVSAILEVFDWREGEFTFQAFEDPIDDWRGPEGLTLPAPVAPEFLALEGARLEDERAAAPATQAVDAGPIDEASPMDWSDLNETSSPIAEVVPEAPQPPTPPPVAPPAPRVAPPVVICVDSELPTLERVKDALASDTTRVHIFQDPADALRRFKQYVVNGTFPVFVMGSSVEDPLDARRGLGWKRFAARLRSLAPSLRIVLLRESEHPPESGLEEVVKPDPRFATEADTKDFLSTLANVVGVCA